MEEEPILEEIDDNTERWIQRISLWVSLLLTTALVVWYYQANPSGLTGSDQDASVL